MTQVFKNQEEFLKASVGPAVNGCDEEFAKAHPEVLTEDFGNKGCWNCNGCTNCVDCDSCTNCHKCTFCTDCTDCSNCYRCEQQTDGDTLFYNDPAGV